MATFNLHVGADPRGAKFTRKADGVVLFGALLVRGSADGDVAETGTTSASPWAVSLVSEVMSFENSAEQYDDNELLNVMTLVPGMVLNLLAGGTINEGDAVCPSTDGKVVASAAAAWENEIGIAIDDIASGARGRICITKCGPQ